MEYAEVDRILDEMCRELDDIGVSGRLRTHNRIMNELGQKALPIERESTWTSERRYQALLNARKMLHELTALVQLSVSNQNILNQNRENVLDQQRKQTANDSGKKRKAKFPLRMSEVLAVLGGSFLGAMLTRILLG